MLGTESAEDRRQNVPLLLGRTRLFSCCNHTGHQVRLFSAEMGPRTQIRLCKRVYSAWFHWALRCSSTWVWMEVRFVLPACPATAPRSCLGGGARTWNAHLRPPVCSRREFVELITSTSDPSRVCAMLPIVSAPQIATLSPPGAVRTALRPVSFRRYQGGLWSACHLGHNKYVAV